MALSSKTAFDGNGLSQPSTRTFFGDCSAPILERINADHERRLREKLAEDKHSKPLPPCRKK
jgi:hypothetical protein